MTKIETWLEKMKLKFDNIKNILSRIFAAILGGQAININSTS